MDQKPRSRFDIYIEEYDPDLHGTMKEYCAELGLNYNSFKNARSLKKRRENQPIRKCVRVKEYLDEYDCEKESMKAFCERKGINYQSFRSARYLRGITNEGKRTWMDVIKEEMEEKARENAASPENAAE